MCREEIGEINKSLTFAYSLIFAITEINDIFMHTQLSVMS